MLFIERRNIRNPLFFHDGGDVSVDEVDVMGLLNLPMAKARGF
jgi:hypothetical protein